MPDDMGLWVTAVALAAGGVLLIWVGAKQRAGTLRRNSLVGLRTWATMRDDAAWQRAHDATAGQVTAAGILPLVAAAMLVLLQPADGLAATMVLGSVAGMLGLVSTACVRGHRLAKELLGEVGAGRDEPEPRP